MISTLCGKNKLRREIGINYGNVAGCKKKLEKKIWVSDLNISKNQISRNCFKHFLWTDFFFLIFL